MESAFQAYNKKLISKKTRTKNKSSIKKKKDTINNQKVSINKKTKELLLDYAQSSEINGKTEQDVSLSSHAETVNQLAVQKQINRKKKNSKLDINTSITDFSIENVQNPLNSSLDTSISSTVVPDDFYEQPEKVFSWLISPLKPFEFFETKWEKIPIHIKRNRKNVYQQLLTTNKLQSIFLDNVLFYTRNVDVVSYINNKRETHNVEGRTVPGGFVGLLQNGCSIRILNPHTYCSKLHSLLASLQEYFGCMAGVNAYLTPPGSQGFAPHYDDIEAFVLQLEGRKHWRLYAPLTLSEVLPRYSSKNFERDELDGKTSVKNLTLEAGDLLYFPRGTIHEGFTDSEMHSLHITISVYQKTAYVDLMEHILKFTLRAATSDDQEFREGLPLQYLKHSGFANDDCDSEIRMEIKAKVKKLLTKMIDHLDIDSAADELGKQFIWDSMPPIPSKAEKQHMTLLNGERIDGGKIYDRVDLDLDVEVRLLRYHCLRLVKDDNDERSLRIYYNTDNAKYYHGEDLQFVVIDNIFEDAIKCLIHSYPNFVKIDKLPLDSDRDKIQIVSDLWEKGLIVTKNPLKYISD